MNWNQIVQHVTPHIVKIETPSGHGTGFLYLHNQDRTWCGIATACHVVDYADEWSQPIRLRHHSSNSPILLKEDSRVVFKDYATDSAVILFFKNDFPLPENPIPLLPAQTHLSIGHSVGWLGFPSVAPSDLCFFSGGISARQEARNSYLIDGVAINGVSGGPVLYADETNGVQIVGIVSAYQANRATGEALPGLLISQDVSHFHDVASHVRSVDEANKKKEQFELEQNAEDS